MNRIYILVGLAIGIVVGAALFYAHKDEMQPEPRLYETEKTVDLDQKASDSRVSPIGFQFLRWL